MSGQTTLSGWEWGLISGKGKQEFPVFFRTISPGQVLKPRPTEFREGGDAVAALMLNSFELFLDSTTVNISSPARQLQHDLKFFSQGLYSTGHRDTPHLPSHLTCQCLWPVSGRSLWPAPTLTPILSEVTWLVTGPAGTQEVMHYKNIAQTL